MSNYHFGDDYDLNYYPLEASDGMGGVDWDKVERVEIECDMYVKERTCELIDFIEHVIMDEPDITELSCGHDCMVFGREDIPNYCPNCGAKVVME